MFVLANPGGGFALSPRRPSGVPADGIMMPTEQYFARRERRLKMAEKARERILQARRERAAEENQMPPAVVPVELVAPSAAAYEESPRTDVRTFLANLGVT